MKDIQYTNIFSTRIYFNSQLHSFSFKMQPLNFQSQHACLPLTLRTAITPKVQRTNECKQQFYF